MIVSLCLLFASYLITNGGWCVVSVLFLPLFGFISLRLSALILPFYSFIPFCGWF